MKKWIVRAVVVVLLLVVAVLVVVYLNLNSVVKKGVETIAPRLTQTEVKLESANISPFSGSGQLKGLFVGNPQGYSTPSAIKIGDLKVSLETSSALSDLIVIDSINLQGAEITFEGGLAGNNLSKILDNLNKAGGGESPTEKAPPEQGGKKFKVKDVVVSGAKVNINITGLGATKAVLPLPDLHLQNIGTDNNGVTAAELGRQILKPLLASVVKVVAENGTKLGGNLKEIGAGASGQIQKTTKGLKGLFKK